LSVLDLAPGGAPIRLVVYSKSALKEIEKIKSPHLELLVNVYESKTCKQNYSKSIHYRKNI